MDYDFLATGYKVTIQATIIDQKQRQKMDKIEVVAAKNKENRQFNHEHAHDVMLTKTDPAE